MKHSWILLFISGLLFGCQSNVKVVKTDLYQFRRTMKDDVRQLNFELILEMPSSKSTLDMAELDVTVNGRYLGKSVIGGTSQPIETQRYRMPVRVTFPDTTLVITDENTVLIEGTLQINGKRQNVSHTEKAAYINNMTAL